MPITQSAPIRCLGVRDRACHRLARPGSDWCVQCEPRCASCGHRLGAHDEGPCAVNHHETAEGPECECQEYVSADED